MHFLYFKLFDCRHHNNDNGKEPIFDEYVIEGESKENVYSEELYNEKVEEPKIGMTFDTIEEVTHFYENYGKQMGFGVFKRSSRKSLDDEETRYATIDVIGLESQYRKCC